LKSAPVKPVLLSKKGDELAISGEILLELMQAVLDRGVAFRFRAKGWSMTPFIRDGDEITIVPLTKENVTIGKVVAFIQPASGHLAVHRVIGRRGASYLIRGDNASSQPDGVVQLQDILGCVTRVERNGRRVYLGQGPERYLVAYLSRNGMLAAALRRLRAMKGIFLT